MEFKPKDVMDYKSLKQLAQMLCDEPNNVDGILILRPTSENPIYLEVCVTGNFKGIDTDALGGRILEVIKFSDRLVISHSDFNPGAVKSIVYEFDDLAFVVYHVRADNLKSNSTYLVLVNAKDKDLGAFNANRGRIRAQMEVGIKRVSVD